ncbi:hypothetical protein FZEAL_3979 [Fusarium zealandicum]|uniref:Uncharacterized protein n=1 Tax=Fusarium zealandicum TaxID=1053134 RepID=A0A8H4UNE0_9HYPO|nr:hypothetical protein FZEAL_3979 [Fusarium zealandicum]
MPRSLRPRKRADSGGKGGERPQKKQKPLAQATSDKPITLTDEEDSPSHPPESCDPLTDFSSLGSSDGRGCVSATASTGQRRPSQRGDTAYSQPDFS